MILALSLEQVRFIAATVAPKVGPLLDRPLSQPMTDQEIVHAASMFVATDETVHAAIVAEIFPETSADTNPLLIAVQAARIIAATIAAHDNGEIINTVAAELMPHSAALRGDLRHG